MRHKLRIKVESNSKEKKGFTLVELLAVIAIIGIIGGISITVFMSTINKSKEEATIIAINNVKSAAELYSKENDGEIKWITQYKEDGTETGKFVCMTVRQLINNGYFDDKFFEEDIYHERINDNTFIEIKQGTNYDNTDVIIHEDDTTQNDCEISAINDSLSNINIDGKESFTDRLSFEATPSKNEVGDVTFFANYEKNNYKSNNIDCNNGKCLFEKLEDNTGYKIKICMSPADGNTTLKNTVCEYFGQATETFMEPTIKIENANKWKQSKNVTITYDDTGIYDEKGIHYFKSEINASFVFGKIYECSNFKDGKDNICNNEVNADDNIRANTWYKVEGEKVEFNVETHISKGNSKIITARIQDQTGNYMDSKENITRIDTEPPTCISSGGNDSWTNKDVILTGTCSDGDSGCSKKTITTPVNYSVQGEVKVGEVKDKAGNKAQCPTQNVLVDKDPPTKCNVSGGNPNWINSYSSKKTVTITAKCGSDIGGSGCDSARDPAPKVYSSYTNTDKAGAGGIGNGGRVYDRAGNYLDCDANQTVKIDTNLPKCNVSGGTGDSWINYAVTVTGTCDDGGESGCKGNVSYTVNDLSYNGNVSPGTVYDKAGNARTCDNVKVKIDRYYPKCNSSSSADGWTNKDVTVTGTCSDTGGSGCKGNVSVVKNSTFKGDVSPGTVCDYANNCTTCDSKRVKVDKTAPTVGDITKSTSKPSGHGCAAASNSKYYFYFKISDGESGLKSGRFKWSTTDQINAGNSTARDGKSHWECIGTSAKNKKQLALKYKVCDKAGNCTKKNW